MPAEQSIVNRLSACSQRFIRPLFWLLPLLILPVTGLAQQGLTAEDVAGIKTVTGGVLSDDGTHAAYTISVPADPRKKNRPTRTELHLIELDTGETRPYHTNSPVASIAFRPGHQSVTFLSRKEGDDARSLYEVPIDGGEAERIYTFDRNILSYEWGPDGNRLAFVAHEDLDLPESSLPYAPDIFEENQPDRKGFITNLSQERPQTMPIQADGSIYIQSWNSDGDRLAISTAPTPGIDDYYMFQQVLVVDATSGEVTAKINNEGKIAQIEWSPDGSRLAIRAGKEINDPIDGRILVVSTNGGTPQIIHQNFEGKFEQIKWTEPDRITFLASESVWTTFGSIRPDGTRLRYEVEREDDPSLISFDRNSRGTTLFTADHNSHPPELYLLSSDASQPERLTHTNPWLDEIEMGRQEVVRYETRDGTFDIDGVLIYPLGDRDGEPFPVITVVHGGPEAHYRNGWLTSYSMPGQMGAASGYGVFYPNYRGSTGRGIDFVYSSQGDAGGKEFDDVVDGVDFLIEQGLADPDRIGVTGGSYGGYASGWMATYYSDRFAASVMFVGVSNNISKWGTSDIPEELYLVHARERLWDDNWMKYLERSPIYWVDRANTPILILHGSEDTRVHPSQSLELYRHIKVRRPDVPLRLVFYPDEGHGHARSTARYDYSLRMMQWFDTYLKTGDRRAERPGATIQPAD